MKAKVLIVGGGWSGLSAACWLSRAQLAPTVLEMAPQFGGRARTVSSSRLDNGQHLFLGAYSALFELLELLKINYQDIFLQKPFYWKMHSSNTVFNINLEKPWNLFKTLSLKEIAALIKLLYSIRFDFFRKELNTYKTVAEFLAAKQPKRLQEFLWEPLCLAAFSTPASMTCTKRFLTMIQALIKKKHSRFYFSTIDLSNLFPIPAKQFIENSGGALYPRQRVQALVIEQDRVIGVKTTSGVFFSDHVILATPPWVSKELINPYPVLEALERDLSQFRPTAITTVYLQFDPRVSLPEELTGLIDSQAQWIFDRRFMGQPGLLAVIITGLGVHLSQSTEDLVQSIENELHLRLGTPKKAQRAKVIREKQAAFFCTPLLPRLTNQTPLKGLWLCGDYLHADHPASIESAVTSAKQTAELVLKELHYDPSRLNTLPSKRQLLTR